MERNGMNLFEALSLLMWFNLKTLYMSKVDIFYPH